MLWDVRNRFVMVRESCVRFLLAQHVVRVGYMWFLGVLLLSSPCLWRVVSVRILGL